VLSVGDISFQQKSLRRMLEFRDQANAMVFVSHNLTAVQQLCNRVIWLDYGKVIMASRPDEVIDQYRRASERYLLQEIRTKQIAPDAAGADAAKITRVEILDSVGQIQSTFRVGDGLAVRLSVSIRQPLTELVCAVAVYRHDGLKLGETNNRVDGFTLDRVQGQGQVVLELPRLSLAPGTYYVNVAISESQLVTCDHITCAAQFEIQGTEVQSHVPGPLYFEGNWKYSPQGEAEHEKELMQR
jgi:ABC-type glutathione transport system ATPase component